VALLSEGPAEKMSAEIFIRKSESMHSLAVAAHLHGEDRSARILLLRDAIEEVDECGLRPSCRLRWKGMVEIERLPKLHH
jgi:hypothetical protein